jgi:hypothetical protein
MNVKEVLNKSVKSGMSGAGAMTIQVGSLMWMRTIMNHQYRYGGTIGNTISSLYKQGGITRFYKGIGPALLQGPLSRFGDTFSNTFALSLCKNNSTLNSMPIFIQTGFASVTAGLFRILLMPIDTTKTIMQVEGKNGLNILMSKLKAGGIPVLFHGSLATASATMVGHYPWFATYNYLDNYLSKYDDKVKNLTRSAVIGFTASIVSDSLSNSLRVVKTIKQSYSTPVSYITVTKDIIQKNGVRDLLGRGLPIRLATNGIQGILFSVLWRYFNGNDK